MNLESLQAGIAAAERRYQSLHADGSSPPLDEVMQQLGTTLEELRVASEEIHSQGDRLAILQEAGTSLTRRFRDHFELAPVPYLVTDRDGMIRDANLAAETLFGRTRAVLTRLPIVALASAPERFPLRARIVRLRAEPVLQSTAWDLRLRHPSRGPFEATVSVSRARGPGDDAEDLRWIVLPRPAVPQAAFDAERLPLVLADTAEDLADGILLVTSRGVPLWWNSAFLAASGIAASDLVSRGVVDCLSDRAAEPEHLAGLVRGLERSATPAPPERIRLRDGRTIALTMRSRQLDGAVVGHSWTLRDVTVHEQASDLAARLERAEATIAELRHARERADAATADGARLLGALAHEIRNPMNALLGATAIIGETDLSEEQAEFMAIIERSGANVLEIVRSVLELARVRSEAGETTAAELDLADVVENTVRSACTGPQADGTDVARRADPALPRR